MEEQFLSCVLQTRHLFICGHLELVHKVMQNVIKEDDEKFLDK